VHRDPDEPGPELRFATKLSEMGEGARIGFLHHVLGLGVVPQNGPRRAKHPLIVPAHDALEERRLTGQDAADQHSVGIGCLRGCRGAQHSLPSQ
jgi:hypothetical protein